MRFVVFLFILVSLGPGLDAVGQQTHEIRAYDHYFSPDSVYMSSGDSIRLVSFGNHNMTEVDDTTWAQYLNMPNGGFLTQLGADTTFEVTGSGKRFFVCQVHAWNGMRGILFVDGVQSSEPGEPDRLLTVYPNPTAEQVTLHGLPNVSHRVQFYGVDGALVSESILAPGQSIVNLDGMPCALYLVRVISAGKVQTVRLIIDK